MAEEKENKIVLEREYIVPMRQEWLKVPEFKRANKAVKALKQFIAQHMKVYDRDLKKILVDVYLNNEIRFRGMRKPPAKIKVKAIKYEDGYVSVKLVDFPKHIEFEMARKVKRMAEQAKKESKSSKEVEEKPTEEKQTEQEKKDEAEKEESSKEATQLAEKNQAKQIAHTSKTASETPKIQRKAMQR